MQAMFKNPTPGRNTEWIATLDKYFTQGGLELIAYEHYPVRDTLRPLFNLTIIMGYEARCKNLEEQGMIEQAKMAREHLKELTQEFRKGAVISGGQIGCIGRKPVM
jgi:hypothetical protein